MVCTADGKAGIWLQFCLTLKRTLRLHQLILKLPQDPFVGTSCYHVVFFIQSLSQVRLFATPWTAAQEALSGFPVLHHFPEFAQTHAHRSQWCYPTISSSIVPFSSCLQSFPASGSFPVSRLFASGDRNTATSASASILPMNIQGWFLLGLTGWISVLFKRLSGVFSSATSLSCIQLFILFHVSILSWPC